MTLIISMLFERCFILILFYLAFLRPSNRIRFTHRVPQKNRSLEDDCVSFTLYPCDLQERVLVALYLRKKPVRLNLKLEKNEWKDAVSKLVLEFLILNKSANLLHKSALYFNKLSG